MAAMIATMVVNDYCERLQKAMDAKSMSRQDLAAAMGISYQAVRKVLTGGTKAFSAEHNSKAASLLGVDPDWLATGRSSANRQAPAPAQAREASPSHKAQYWPFSTPIDVFQRAITAEELQKINSYIEICVRSARSQGKTATRA